MSKAQASTKQSFHPSLLLHLTPKTKFRKGFRGYDENQVHQWSYSIASRTFASAFSWSWSAFSWPDWPRPADVTHSLSFQEHADSCLDIETHHIHATRKCTNKSGSQEKQRNRKS